MAQAAYNAEVLADTPDLFWKLNDASGNPVDSSGNGRNATSTASVTYQQPGPFSGSFSVLMPGGGSVKRTPVPTSVTDNFTLECWFKFDLISVDNQIIIYNGGSGTDGYGLLVRSGASQFLRYLAGGVSLGGNTSDVVTSAAFKHLAIIRRAGDWEIWVNASLNAGGITTPGTPVGNFQIASDANLQGYWSNTAVYSTALSGARILAHYNAGIAAGSDGATLLQGRMRSRRTSW